MDAELIHELGAAYALNALDPQEERFYQRHLAHCARCQADVTSFAATVAALGYAAPTVDLPPGLRQRILDATRSQPAQARPRWHFRAPPALAAAAVLLCAVIGGLTVWATSSDDNRAPFNSQRRLQLSGATGSIVRSGRGEATLIVFGLHAAPTGEIYEAWVIQNGTAVPAGVFLASTGKTVVRLTRRLPHGATVAVTIESAPGTTRLTQPPLFTSPPA